MSRGLGITTLKVLHAVASGVRYGFDIMDETGLPSGTVYPALSRLERMGHLRARWEPVREARREKRPPRKYYTLTASGRTAFAEGAAAIRELGRVLPGTLRELKKGRAG